MRATVLLEEREGRGLSRGDLSLLFRLLSFTKGQIPYLVLSLASMGLATLSTILQPYGLKLIVDRNFVPGRTEGLFINAGVFAAGVIGSMVFGYLQMVSVAALGQRTIHELRKELFEKILRLPMTFFDRTHSGWIVARLVSDVDAVNEMISSGIVSSIADVFLMASIAVVLFLLDAGLFLTLMGTLIILILFVFLLKGKLRAANREVRRATADLTRSLQETVGGLEVVRAFGREEKVLEEFRKVNARYVEGGKRLSKIYSLYFPGVEFLSHFGLALIILVGGYYFRQGSVTLGTLVAFIGYLEKFFGPVRDMTDKVSVLQTALAAAERIFSILDLPPSREFSFRQEKGGISPRGGRGEAVVEMENVTFGYDDEEVLRGLSLKVRRGERVAIVGLTGAGKSTIVNLLLSFYEPWEGEVRIFGHSLSEISPREVREKIAFVPQEPFLFEGTVVENVTGGLPLDEMKLERVLAICDILKDAESTGSVSSRQVGERGLGLSAGERQLVAIARALYRDPELLILDESAAHLDPKSEEKVSRAVRRLLAGRTAIVIAHRLATVSECDRIVVIAGGKVVEEGTHDELLRRDGLYRKLWRLQSMEEKREESER
ncbi:MAG: ABC transporter ATP-binding protein [Deltaproteobacteria bacterium]|nr:MAG: ABC transporter ATP-binding protein [Deltaproteobacteria bacterium]